MSDPNYPRDFFDKEFPESFEDSRVPDQSALELVAYRGDTFTFTRQVYADQNGNLTSVDPTNPEDIPPPNFKVQDLTGWRVTCTIKRSYSDPDNQAVVQLDTATLGGVTILSPAQLGKCQTSVPPLVSRGLPDWTTIMLVDLKGKDPSGNMRTLASGTIAFLPSVTSTIS